MADALIVSGGEKGRCALRGLLSEMGVDEAECLCDGGEARRALAESDYALLVVNTPLQDESGAELAVDAAGSTGAGVVLLVKAEAADEMAARVEDAGVFVVAKPLNRTLLFGAVKLALAAHRRLVGLQQQNTKLQQKIDDIRLVDRAKCALIQYRQLTEPEAHKYIERQAMDGRRSRRAVAEEILLNFEGHL